MDSGMTASAPPVRIKELDGLVLHGLIVVAHARVLERKNGSGRIVKVVHEVLSGGELASIEDFYDPQTDERIRVEGDNVTQYPHMPGFARIDYLVERFSTENGRRLIVKKGRLLSIREAGAPSALANVASRQPANGR